GREKLNEVGASILEFRRMSNIRSVGRLLTLVDPFQASTRRGGRGLYNMWRWRSYDQVGGSHLVRCDDTKKLFGVGCGYGRRIRLPFFIFVGIGIVADTSDHKTREFIHQPCSLHFEAQDIMLSP